ncbi:MAG: TDP-N-acetylfucosamine:lipid II N-acetylfucosaminyltransferase [Bacteroidales bacterium]|nr:TDP-N-acetylfucosamine:lipid II N-acetylfucosaminyltransferase [Bacteroidales bacterium]
MEPDRDSRPCIIHLFEDQKVVERVLSNFETAFPSIKQKAIVVLNDVGQERYIINKKRFVFIEHGQLKPLLKELDPKNTLLILIHYLTSNKVSALSFVPAGIKVGWTIYGGDLYNRYLRFLGYDVFYDKKNIQDSLLLFLRQSFLRPIKYVLKRRELSRVLKRISMTCAIETDVYLLHKVFPKIHIVNHEFYAYSLEDTVGSLINSGFENKGSIMVGNSASCSNNHLYVLHYLENLVNPKNKVFLQLAYSGNPDYRNRVKKEYSERLTCSISFIENFVPLEEYNAFIKTVSFFFFGHWRQEALGNLIVAFYIGGKVFLSNRNPLLAYFRDKGIKVFEIETVDESSLRELTVEEKQWNRDIIYGLYNKSRALDVLRNGIGSELVY